MYSKINKYISLFILLTTTYITTTMPEPFCLPTSRIKENIFFLLYKDLYELLYGIM